MRIIPIDYHAPNPYPDKKSWRFPFFTLSLSMGKGIGKLVLPAQLRPPQHINLDKVEKIALNLDVIMHGGKVYTHDDAELDTIQITPYGTYDSEASEKYYIVKFNGNGMYYENALNQFAYDANKLKSTVIGFNYRGVNNSKKSPECFEELIFDGIAQVKRLIENGADPKKITLDGLSLGGAVATMVAKYFHDQNLRVYLWNDRSLASLSKATAGMMAPDLKGLSGDLSFTFLESSFWSSMAPLGWEANIASAYKAIPAEYKGYMVVAKSSQKSTGDGVIAHRASLDQAVKTDEKLKNKRTGHKVFSHGLYGGHNEQRENLLSKEDSLSDGQDLFENFVHKSRL